MSAGFEPESSVATGPRPTGRAAVAGAFVPALLLALAAAGEEAHSRSMTLADAVAAAVANSRAIRDVRLSRSSDRLDLRIAERQFVPDLELSSSAERSRTLTFPATGDDSASTAGGARVQALASMALPTGGQLAFGWDLSSTSSRESGASARDADHGRGWQATLVQPLMRGGGTEVGTAELRIARLKDRKSALDLRQRVMEVISEAILAFHDLARAQDELEIAQGSLAEAKRLAEVSHALIDAGRMAPVDLIQADTEVANKDLDVLVASSRLEAARLALVDVLDLPVDTVIEPVATTPPSPSEPDTAAVQTVALERRPDLLGARLDLEVAREELAVANNARLPAFDFVASYGGTVDHPALASAALRDRGWSAGLTLGYTLGDTERSVRYRQAQIAVERDELAIRELEDGIRLEIADRVRDVIVAGRGADLARRARELSEKQLEVAAAKLKAGRSSNFEYVKLENDLVAARNRELTAEVSYLDALTRLDLSAGTTLDTWGITVEPSTSEAR